MSRINNCEVQKRWIIKKSKNGSFEKSLNITNNKKYSSIRKMPKT